MSAVAAGGGKPHGDVPAALRLLASQHPADLAGESTAWPPPPPPSHVLVSIQTQRYIEVDTFSSRQVLSRRISRK